MKTIIYLLFMTAISMSQLRASDIIIPVNEGPANEGPVVTIAFELGLKPYCTLKFRLCKVTVGWPTPEKEGITGYVQQNPKTSGSGSGGGGGSSWTLTFSREDFANRYPDFLSNLDGKSTVMFEGPFTLPTEVRDALGATEDLMIKEKTAYPIVFVDGNYSITF